MIKKPAILSFYKENIEDITFSTRVVGSTFYNVQEMLQVVKNNVPTEYIHLRFVREPSNEYDENAVAIYLSITGSVKEYLIGHVPKDTAPIFAYVMENPQEYSMSVYNLKLFGGTKEKPYVGIFFNFHIVLR